MFFLSFLSLLFCCSLSCAEVTIDSLPFYKQTEHFMMYCEPIDHTVADEMLTKSEKDYDELAVLFDHALSKKIVQKMYPDLKSFHEAINEPNAPDWIIGRTEGVMRMHVSPRNPGLVHNYDSVMVSDKVGLIMSFIYDAYPNHQTISRWLHQGVALYKAHFYSQKKMMALVEHIIELPTIEQLDTLDKNDNARFAKMNGFVVAQSLVQYLDYKWGWKIILALLNDYASLEKILGVSKEELHEQWISFLQSQKEL